MIGKTFGRLTVLSECKQRNKHGKIVYKCECECGNIVYAHGHLLRNGGVKSCGCLLKENMSKGRVTHGKSYTRLYHILKGMKDRCYRTNYKYYKHYGGRGIRVCNEWLDDFMNFYNWAMNNGYRDNLSIDRIDNDENYSPDNCRWVDQKTQNNNKRDCVYLKYDGKTQTITQWADELKLNRSTMYMRHRNGWNTKEILFGRGEKNKKHKIQL